MLVAPSISAFSALVSLLLLAYTVYRNSYYHYQKLGAAVFTSVALGNTVTSEPVVQVEYPEHRPSTHIMIIIVNEGTELETIPSVGIEVVGGGGSAPAYPHVILPGKSLTYVIPMEKTAFRDAARHSPDRTSQCVCRIGVFGKSSEMIEKKIYVGEAYFQPSDFETELSGIGFTSTQDRRFVDLV